MDKFAQLISTLLASRDQAHIFHWQTKRSPGSFAAHMALGQYYDEIVGLVDGLVESYQGRYGIVYGYALPATFKEDDQFEKYFAALAKYVEQFRKSVAQDSYLQNQFDEVVDLIETTRYKLDNLH